MEFVGQYLARDFGQSSSQLHAGGAAAHYYEIQLRLLGTLVVFTLGGLALRQFECEQHSPPYLERVFNRLQAGREGLPLVVTEVGMAGACGHNQVVVAGSPRNPALPSAAKDRNPVLRTSGLRHCDGCA